MLVSSTYDMFIDNELPVMPLLVYFLIMYAVSIVHLVYKHFAAISGMRTSAF